MGLDLSLFMMLKDCDELEIIRLGRFPQRLDLRLELGGPEPAIAPGDFLNAVDM